MAGQTTIDLKLYFVYSKLVTVCVFNLLLDFSRRGHCGPYDWFICFIVTLPVAVILTLSLSLSLGTEPHEISSTETYALTDNRIIAYKGDFCQDLRTTSTDVPINQESTGNLYFLKSRPPLTERESFNASVTAIINSDFNFRFWNFYLNAGSRSSFEVCYQQSGGTSEDVIFYIIRGTDQLNEWRDEPRDSNADKSYRLTSQCRNITYEVRQDNMYYFVFYLSGGRSSALDVNFAINRTLYRLLPDDIITDCSFPLDGRSRCVISAPMNSGYTAFLSLNASLPINYSDDGAEINISCQARGWLYAVIVLAVVIFAVLVFACVVVVCVKVVKVGEKRCTGGGRTSRVTTEAGMSNVTNESSFKEPSSTFPNDYSSPPAAYPRAPPPPYSSY